MSKLPINPVDIISKLQYFNYGQQDPFLNTLAFSVQFSSLLIRSTTNVQNPISIGLSNISQHINSSRFVLRFLTGIRSLHVVLENKGLIADLLSKIRSKFDKKYREQFKDKLEASQFDLVPFLRLIQAILNIGYNLSEIPAYIATVAPMLANYDGAKYGQISCIIWLIYTLLEIVIITILRYRKEVSSSEYQYNLIPLTCDSILALNWSVEPKKQFLSEFGLTILGLTSAWMNLASIWKSIPATDSTSTTAPPPPPTTTTTTTTKTTTPTDITTSVEKE